MKKYFFESCLAEPLQDFIKLKKNLGLKYQRGTHFMRSIDKAAIEFKLTSTVITREFAEDFGKLRFHEIKKTQYYRMIHLRTFSRFLVDIGRDSYIPELLPLPKGSSEFTPHIYSDEEIKAILKSCDGLRLNLFHKSNSPIFVLPVLIRFLLATGLRISEALNLKTDQINFEENYLLTKDSKNGRERLIPFSKSLSDVLQNHKKCMDVFCSKKGRSPFYFKTISGSKLRHGSVSANFRKVLKDAGIPYKGRHKGPRIHDFRHTFAVNALNKMVNAGQNFYTSLPILQAYLGHQRRKSTDIYVRLTEPMFAGLIQDAEKFTSEIFPSIN